MQIDTLELIAGRYRLEDQVSIDGLVGNFPVELYNATDEALERPVTVQMLTVRASQNSNMRARFLRRGQLVASLHHPDVDAVYDAGEWQGRPFWVMGRIGEFTAASRYRDSGKPPDIANALGTTRRAAEALQAIREAGLTDWAFSYRAVCFLPHADVCLMIVEGMDQLQDPDTHAVSSRPEDDPSALGALLRLTLVGSTDPKIGAVSDLPAPLAALLDRMQAGSSSGKLASAGQVASAISDIEAASSQATEAYEPDQASLVAPVPMPYYGPSDGEVPPVREPDAGTIALHEAPTLAALAVPDGDLTRATSPVLAQPYLPPSPASSATPGEDRRRGKFSPAIPLLVILLLGAGVLVLILRPRPVGDLAQVGPGMVAAPDVRGKSLEEAGNNLGAAGLHLGQHTPIHDANVAPNIIAQQEPDPGTPLHSGDPVTITLSLGAEVPLSPTFDPTAPTQTPQQPVVAPTEVPAPPVVNSPAPAPKPKPEPPGQNKDHGTKKK